MKSIYIAVPRTCTSLQLVDGRGRWNSRDELLNLLSINPHMEAVFYRLFADSPLFSVDVYGATNVDTTYPTLAYVRTLKILKVEL